MTKHYIIPIFVPHYGCPHDCVFCNQRKITGISSGLSKKEVEDSIKSHLETFKKDSFIEIAFFGGSFTAINILEQRNFLEIALKYKNLGLIQEIRLSTRPDAINKDILDMLREYTVDTIELGVQSLDKLVLKESERGHDDKVVFYASKLIKSYGFKLGLQLMLGLPKDSYEKSMESARKLLQIKPSFIRIYPTLVIKNTKLEFLMNNNLYTPMTLEEAIDLSCEILILFTLNKIPVIRIGLQTTENIQEGKDVLAGPFHPALRQLVEERVFKKLFLAYVYKEGINLRDKEITLICGKLYTSVIAGQKGQNKSQIIKDLGLKNLSIRQEDMDKYIVKLSYDKNNFTINLLDQMKEYDFNY